MGYSLCKEPWGGGFTQGWLKPRAAREPCLNVGQTSVSSNGKEPSGGGGGGAWHLSWAPGHPQR